MITAPPSRRLLSTALLLMGTAAWTPSPAAAGEEGDAASASRFFESYVRPLLATNCFECHGPARQESDIRLDARAVVLEGSDPLVVPGQPDASRLIAAVRHTGDIKMPPEARLPDDAIAVLEAWVKMGAPWPETIPAEASSRAHEIAAAARTHWAYQPVRKPELPEVEHADRASSPVDRFVLAALEQAKLSAAPPADRQTLIRRVTFDLIGLPPTPAEVAQFVQDSSPLAWQRVVDRLLASPHYGERWARHWLDVARYADTKGYILLRMEATPGLIPTAIMSFVRSTRICRTTGSCENRSPPI